jgi:hypothetical protein
MKTGGITASDKRDFGLDLRFTHKKEQFFDAEGVLTIEVITGLQALSRDTDLQKLMQLLKLKITLIW